MTPKTDLHELIRSLTRSEKRYFSLYAQRHVIGKRNKYLELFNCIEKQKVYDEAKVRLLFSAQPTRSNLASEKAYLKTLILRSLKQFHQQNNIHSVLYDKLVQIEILYEKGLFKLGYELIRESIKLTEKHEKYLIHATLLNWKIRYDIQLNKLMTVAKDSQMAKAQVSLFLDSLGNRKVFYSLFLLSSKSKRSQSAAELNLAMRRLKVQLKGGEPQTSMGAYYHYALQSYMAFLRNNTRNMVANLEKGLNVFKGNVVFCQEEPTLYLKLASNFIFSLIIAAQLKKAELELEQFQETASKLKLGNQQEAMAFTFYTDNKLLVLLKQSRYPEALDMARRIEKSLPVYERFQEPVRKMDTYVSLATAYFFTKNYKVTNKFLSRIMRTRSDKDQHASALAFAMVFQLITMIDSGDTLLFSNKLIAAKKYLSGLVQVEWLVQFCDYLKFLESPNPRRSTILQQNKMKVKLIAGARYDEVIKVYMHYFDFVQWLKER
jgi:hypothetical protein